MSELIIKNLPREFRSLEINMDDFKKSRAKRFVENLKEFVEDEKLSNKIMESDELTEILDLISKKI
jgi:predicted house-cleaning noncanonical NTP pyrophosphatase (MazG superfamily)